MKLNKLTPVAILVTFTLIITNCSAPHVDNSSKKDLSLKATSESEVSGDIVLLQKGRDILLKTHIQGLEPNSVHAIHIHEKGDCSSPDASSAGGHFDPEHDSHGAPDAKEHHAGDLGNITADIDGNADIVITGRNLSLDSSSKYSIINRAIVLHEKKDDFISQPSGAAGRRIACAVIY